MLAIETCCLLIKSGIIDQKTIVKIGLHNLLRSQCEYTYCYYIHVNFNQGE